MIQIPARVKHIVLLKAIAGDAESQKERVKDISTHYIKLGGFSPFNELTYKQAKALQNVLEERDFAITSLCRIQTLDTLLKGSHR